MQGGCILNFTCYYRLLLSSSACSGICKHTGYEHIALNETPINRTYAWRRAGVLDPSIAHSIGTVVHIGPHYESFFDRSSGHLLPTYKRVGGTPPGRRRYFLQCLCILLNWRTHTNTLELLHWSSCEADFNSDAIFRHFDATGRLKCDSLLFKAALFKRMRVANPPLWRVSWRSIRLAFTSGVLPETANINLTFLDCYLCCLSFTPLTCRQQKNPNNRIISAKQTQTTNRTALDICTIA